MTFAPKFEKSLWRLTVAFAVLLVAGVAIVQSFHLHEELAPSGVTRSHCALCVFSHSPAVVTVARSVPVPLLDYASLPSVDPQLRSRLLVCSAFIRPPPVL